MYTKVAGYTFINSKTKFSWPRKQTSPLLTREKGQESNLIAHFLAKQGERKRRADSRKIRCNASIRDFVTIIQDEAPSIPLGQGPKRSQTKNTRLGYREGRSSRQIGHCNLNTIQPSRQALWKT